MEPDFWRHEIVLNRHEYASQKFDALGFVILVDACRSFNALFSNRVDNEGTEIALIILFCKIRERRGNFSVGEFAQFRLDGVGSTK